MRAHKVDFRLGDGPHSDLVEGSGEESGKRRHKHDVASTATEPDAHAHHVLLGNETLDESLGAAVLVGDGKRGVLGISVKCHDSGVVLPQLHQSLSIRLPSGNLNKKFVA